jgi:ribosomal protein S28E/S33
MSRREQEWAIKLSLMGSVAKSQEALAKILANVADVVDVTGVAPQTLQEHVRVLTGMQGALLRIVTGMSWRPPVRGTPASPWLSEEVYRSEAQTTGLPLAEADLGKIKS